MSPHPTVTGYASGATHDVFNQSIPRVDLNEYALNLPLKEAVSQYGGSWSDSELSKSGHKVGSGEFRLWAAQANDNPPKLRTHDRYGNRADHVDYHPAYHAIMQTAIESGVHASVWRDPRPGSQVVQTARFLIFSQVETGHGCPTSMTCAAVAALRQEPMLADRWEGPLTALTYDSRPVAAQKKTGVLAGMAMTEKQGGSDVRAITTQAVPVGPVGPGSDYLLTGHKWFCSAPMSDVFLTLAKTAEGISCFLVPRLDDDGRPNGLFLQGLKDKLGNRSNASAELELLGAKAWLVGEPGRGISTIIEMVSHTRLACLAMSTAGMRECVTEAIWHGSHRSTFQKPLRSHPLMLNVLADLCIESEAATAITMRLAHAYDAGANEYEQLFRRIATPVAKYWVCKRGPGHSAEALECLGGNGYIETFPLARRYREQPLMSVWEGAGNVMCLDVLRAIEREPETLNVMFAELELASGVDKRFDQSTSTLRRDLTDKHDRTIRARELTERLALALQASLLIRHAPAAVSDAFCAGRLADNRGSAYGTLPAGIDANAIVARHSPETS